MDIDKVRMFALPETPTIQHVFHTKTTIVVAFYLVESLNQGSAFRFIL